MKDSDSRRGVDVVFCGLITIALIVLKLVGAIEWPWILVFAPIWMPILIAILVVCLIVRR